MEGLGNLIAVFGQCAKFIIAVNRYGCRKIPFCNFGHGGFHPADRIDDAGGKLAR